MNEALKNRTAGKILAVMLAAAVLFTAAAAVRLALSAPERETRLLGDAGEPGETAELFFHTLCLRDWERASGYVLGAPDLDLDRVLEDPVEQTVWEAYLNSWGWSSGAGKRTGELSAEQRILLRRIDTEKAVAGLWEDVQAVLERRVDEARVLSEVYTEDGDYLPEVVESALAETLERRLADPSAYMETTAITLQLAWEDGRWQIVPTEELWNALAGLPVSEGGAA